MAFNRNNDKNLFLKLPQCGFPPNPQNSLPSQNSANSLSKKSFSTYFELKNLIDEHPIDCQSGAAFYRLNQNITQSICEKYSPTSGLKEIHG